MENEEALSILRKLTTYNYLHWSIGIYIVFVIDMLIDPIRMARSSILLTNYVRRLVKTINNEIDSLTRLYKDMVK